MIKYEIMENTKEFYYKHKEKIVAGCTIPAENNSDPQMLETFNNKEDALFNLKKYKTDVKILNGTNGAYYEVTEYYVEEVEFNTEGTWIGGGDIWAYTEMPSIEKM